MAPPTVYYENMDSHELVAHLESVLGKMNTPCEKLATGLK